MAKKASHNVASKEWLESTINKKGKEVGKYGKSRAIRKWIDEHPDFSGTRQEQADAINAFLNGQVTFTITAADISAALQSEKSASAPASRKAATNGVFAQLVAKVMDQLDIESKEDLIKAVETGSPDPLTVFVFKSGGKEATLEKLKNLSPIQPPDVDLDW